LRAIKESYGKNTVHIEFTGPDSFLSLPSIASVDRFAAGAEAKLKPGADTQEILKAAMQAGARINRFELLEPSLNDIFIEKTGHA
jgi:ABC-2 type transport system ATP-binding protein